MSFWRPNRIICSYVNNYPDCSPVFMLKLLVSNGLQLEEAPFGPAMVNHTSASPPHPAVSAGSPAEMPIPDRLNVAIVVVVLSTALGLMWFGSRVEEWYAVAAVGVV